MKGKPAQQDPHEHLSRPPTGDDFQRPDSSIHDTAGAIILMDREGRIDNMNQAARSLLGEPERGLALGDWPRAFGLYAPDGSEFFPPESLPPLRALKSAKDIPAEKMILRSTPDAAERTISMSAGPILSVDGQVDGVTTLILDISADSRHHASDSGPSRQVEGLFRFGSLLAGSVDDVSRIASSVATLASEIIGDISAVTLVEPGTSKMDLIAFHDTDPATTDTFRQLVPRTIDFQGEDSIEAVAMRSGSAVIVPSSELSDTIHSKMFGPLVEQLNVSSLLMVPLLGRTGPLGVITIFRRHGGQTYTGADRTFLTDIGNRAALAIENCLLFDSLQGEIAARLTAAQALDLSEERFQSIFESTSLGIKILDLSGTIIQTNAAFQQIIGYSETEILGRRFYDFLHPSDIVRAVSVFHRLKSERVSTLRFQHRAIRKDGNTVWVNAIFSAIRRGAADPSPAFIVSILEDITEQKHYEAELADLKNRLQSTMELERLRLAHELHDGPMQDLYSVVYELEELRGKLGPEVSRSLEGVAKGVHRVVNELRDTAKELRPPTISQFGLEKTIRSYVADLQEKHPELTIHLSLARDHQLLPEEVRLALFRVLQQSLSNIVRHAQASEVRVRFTFDAEEARLEVWDNGRGFQVPSNWVDFVREGHYGLAGAAERVSALGGAFVVESQPPSSTTVRAIIRWKEHLQ